MTRQTPSASRTQMPRSGAKPTQLLHPAKRRRPLSATTRRSSAVSTVRSPGMGALPPTSTSPLHPLTNSRLKAPHSPTESRRTPILPWRRDPSRKLTPSARSHSPRYPQPRPAPCRHRLPRHRHHHRRRRRHPPHRRRRRHHRRPRRRRCHHKLQSAQTSLLVSSVTECHKRAPYVLPTSMQPPTAAAATLGLRAVLMCRIPPKTTHALQVKRFALTLDPC
mmetsp:Transcript_49837/g.164984  ORF Transcript_49837/g.164984 Transcript_49837/m.164984 type:complete len:221 (-) Transcript_49837:389-1051(-)